MRNCVDELIVSLLAPAFNSNALVSQINICCFLLWRYGISVCLPHSCNLRNVKESLCVLCSIRIFSFAFNFHTRALKCVVDSPRSTRFHSPLAWAHSTHAHGSARFCFCCAYSVQRTLSVCLSLLSRQCDQSSLLLLWRCKCVIMCTAADKIYAQPHAEFTQDFACVMRYANNQGSQQPARLYAHIATCAWTWIHTNKTTQMNEMCDLIE